MIVVKIEMWPSGLEGKAFELARLYIARLPSSTENRGDYKVALMRRGEKRAPWPIGFGLNKNDLAKPIRLGEVRGHPRLAEHVLSLVRKAAEVLYPEYLRDRPTSPSRPSSSKDSPGDSENREGAETTSEMVGNPDNLR